MLQAQNSKIFPSLTLGLSIFKFDSTNLEKKFHLEIKFEFQI